MPPRGIRALVFAALLVVAVAVCACGGAAPTTEVEFISVEPAEGVEVLVPDENLDSPLGTTPFRVPVGLGPGSYTYIASAPGYHPVTAEFTLGEG